MMERWERKKKERKLHSRSGWTGDVHSVLGRTVATSRWNRHVVTLSIRGEGEARDGKFIHGPLVAESTPVSKYLVSW